MMLLCYDYATAARACRFSFEHDILQRTSKEISFEFPRPLRSKRMKIKKACLHQHCAILIQITLTVALGKGPDVDLNLKAIILIRLNG